MIPIPKQPAIDIETFYQSTQGGEKLFLLKTAVDYKVFEFFQEPASANEFADTRQTDLRLTEKFLCALSAINLLTKADSTFCNTPLASNCFIEGKPFFQGNLVGLMLKTRQERWANLGRCLKEGPMQPQRDQKQTFDVNFTKAMAEGAMRGGLHRTVDTVTALPEFPAAKKLVDIGGAHGLYAMAFAQANPELRSIVFDLPQVIEATNDYIRSYEMQDRVTAIAGDYTTDDWGDNVDIVFASDCLYRGEEELIPVLRKIEASLNPGGLFISKHWMMNDGRTSPDTTVFFDLMIALAGNSTGYICTSQESMAMMESVGFEVESFDVPTPSKPSVILVGRKNGG